LSQKFAQVFLWIKNGSNVLIFGLLLYLYLYHFILVQQKANILFIWSYLQNLLFKNKESICLSGTHCVDIELFVTGTKMRQFNKSKLLNLIFSKIPLQNLQFQNVESICLSCTHCMDIDLFVTGTKMRQFNKPRLPKSRP
jgi:hypothetical protein